MPVAKYRVEGHDISETSAPTALEPFFHGKPPKLWSVGDTAILDRRLLGIISARRIDTDLALRSSQLLKQLASLDDVAFISGWHSPMEEDALRILSANSVRIVFCLAKALNRFIPSLQVKNEINDGRVLLLTHCSLKAKRISRDASLRRTHLVVGLAATVLVLSAPEGSASLELARSALRQGKPVYTLEHRLNKQLLASGALSATLEKIDESLR